MNDLHQTFLRSAAVCALFVLSVQTLFGQRQAGSEIDADTLLRTVRDKEKDGEASKTHFTYRIFEHVQNMNEKGKKTADFTTLSEMIYLSDQPYIHRLEVNGKPLSGKALEAEQQRYDAAVKENKGFSEKQRAEQAGGKHKEVNISLGKLLTAYDNRIVGTETFEGTDCVVIDAMPKFSIPEAPKRHVVVWVNSKSMQMVRLAFDLIADEEDLEKGSSGWMQMKEIDGVTVDTKKHIDFRLAVKNRKKDTARVVTDATMTDFHRFTSSLTITVPDEPAEQ